MFDGFLSLWLPMFDGIGSMLWRREGGLNEELADFLSITHTTSTNAFGAWPIRPTAHPWVTAGQRPRFVTPDEALQRISKGWWDAEREVFLSRGTSGSITAGEDRTARLGELRFESQRVGFEVTAAVDTMVVVAQLHHPGWRASVDGNEVKIWPANLGFQAMEVPAGHHVVELRYVERWFVPGLGVSAVTILLLAGLGWRWRRSPGCPPHVSQG